MNLYDLAADKMTPTEIREALQELTRVIAERDRLREALQAVADATDTARVPVRSERNQMIVACNIANRALAGKE